MKKRYLSLLIAATLSNQVLAKEIQELDTTEVTAKKTTDITVSAEELKQTQINDIKGVFKEVAQRCY
jgi:hypothetical protein